jgi:hypothetical protein
MLCVSGKAYRLQPRSRTLLLARHPVLRAAHRIGPLKTADIDCIEIPAAAA